MTKRQADNWRRVCDRLGEYGIEYGDINALRRIEMTLSRWGERECGDEYGNCIERDEVTGRPYNTYDSGNGQRKRYAIPDREKGALRRLDVIMSKHPDLVAYHQGDPRGCSLYVCKKSDVGDKIDSLYTHGISVCY